jgi:exopolyphosphatase/pppGpp-phosphohydrolase
VERLAVMRRGGGGAAGVSENRAAQLLARAVGAARGDAACDLEQVSVCPWALREGVILRRARLLVEQLSRSLGRRCPRLPRVTPDPAVRVPAAKVGLATASVYPESTANAFEIAARLGYDGVEVMVWTDPVSQDVTACAGCRTTTRSRSWPCTRRAW